MDKVNRNGHNRVFSKSKTDEGIIPRIHKNACKTRKQ